MHKFCIYKACMVLNVVEGNINFYLLHMPLFTHVCGYIGMAISTSR